MCDDDFDIDELLAGDDNGFQQDDIESYYCSSNEAIHLRIVNKEEDTVNKDLDFHPLFTNQLFKNEKVFGYKGLRIDLWFNALTFDTYLRIEFSEKVEHEALNCPAADDIETVLSERLLGGYTKNIDVFVSTLKLSFEPFGKTITAWEAVIDNVQWSYNFAREKFGNTRVNEWHKKIQFLMLVSIDGASYLSMDDPLWDISILWAKKTENSAVSFVCIGYITTYSFFAPPDSIRKRISQVVVLHPYQKRGLGSKMLNALSEDYIADKSVKDITIEDAADGLQRIRDKTDCIRVMQKKYDTSQWTDTLKFQLESELKLYKSQAQRVFEILKLQALDKTPNAAEYSIFKRDVKRRLYQSISVSSKRVQAVPTEEEQDLIIEGLDKSYVILEDEYRSTIDGLPGMHYGSYCLAHS